MAELVGSDDLNAALETAASDVKRLCTESMWNSKYFNILRKPFTTLASGSVRQVCSVTIGLFHPPVCPLLTHPTHTNTPCTTRSVVCVHPQYRVHPADGVDFQSLLQRALAHGTRVRVCMFVHADVCMRMCV